MLEVAWFHWVNILACTVLLGFTAIASQLIPHRGMWGRRISIWVVAILLGFQAASPFMGVMQASWHGSLLHAMIAGCAVFRRKQVIAFLKANLDEATPEPTKEMRRSSDWADLDEWDRAAR